VEGVECRFDFGVLSRIEFHPRASNDAALKTTVTIRAPLTHVPCIRERLLNLLQFQKLLIINMPERTDRRDAISLAAAVSNMSVEFAMDVRGESIPEDALPPGASSESIGLFKGIKGS
jgi:hypothetical protein